MLKAAKYSESTLLVGHLPYFVIAQRLLEVEQSKDFLYQDIDHKHLAWPGFLFLKTRFSMDFKNPFSQEFNPYLSTCIFGFDYSSLPVRMHMLFFSEPWTSKLWGMKMCYSAHLHGLSKHYFLQCRITDLTVCLF